MKANPLSHRGDLLKDRAAGGAFWSTVEVWATEILQLLIFAVLARLLGPEPYGIVGLAMMLVLVGQSFLTQGGWIQAIVHRPDLEESHLNASFWGVLAVGCTLAVIILLAAPILAYLFDDPRLARIMPALAPYPLIVSLYIVPTALLQRQLKMAPLALRALLATGIAGIVGIVLAIEGYGVWSLVAYELLFPIVTVLVLWKAAAWRPAMAFSMPHFRSMFKFSSRVLGERLIALSEALVPRAFLGYFNGPAPVGLWSLSIKIFNLSSELVIRPAIRVTLPSFAEAQADSARLVPMLTLALRLTGLFAIPGFVILATLSDELVPMLFGKEWLEAGNALGILAIAGLVAPISQLTVTLMQGTGRVGLSLKLAVAGFVLLLLFFVVLAPFGIIGFAAAMAARGWIMLPVRLVVLRTSLGISPARVLLPMMPLVVAGGVMAAFIVSVRFLPGFIPASWLVLAAEILGGGLVYLATLFVLDRQLIEVFRSFTGRMLRKQN